MKFFSTKEKDKYIGYYFFGIRVFKKANPFYKLEESFKKNKHFNCFKYDINTIKIVDRICGNLKVEKKSTNSKRIAFLATELYETGGHTEWMKNIIYAIQDLFEIKTYLTRNSKTKKLAPNRLAIISKYSDVFGVDAECNRKKDILTLFYKIQEYAPKVIFVFMHMNDFSANSLLYLIKKYTNIRIIYCNHGSHWPLLGELFADASTVALPTTIYVDEVYRDFHKDIRLNLCDSFEEDIVDLSEQEKKKVRDSLDIKDWQYFTLTGCTSYKLFSGNESPYFKMVKRLLETEKSLVHVVITNLNRSEKDIVNDIFKNSSVKDRLKIIDITPNYTKYFQSCDLFIDSFPIASALTHIELMKHKKVSVIKINNENALYSFHEYFPENYPYMTHEISKMEEIIFYLLHNPDEIKKASKLLYSHYLNVFEAKVVRSQCIKIVENADQLYKLFVHVEKDCHYNLEIKK